MRAILFALIAFAIAYGSLSPFSIEPSAVDVPTHRKRTLGIKIPPSDAPNKRASFLGEVQEAYNNYDPRTLQAAIDSIGTAPDFSETFGRLLRERLVRTASHGKNLYLLRIPNNPLQKRSTFYFPETETGYGDLLKWYKRVPEGLTQDVSATIEYKDGLFKDEIYKFRDTWNGENGDFPMTEVAPMTFQFCWHDCPKKKALAPGIPAAVGAAKGGWEYAEKRATIKKARA